MTGSLGLTLLVALATALVLGVVAHRLRLPPMVGYIAAGLAVGPFTPGIVADREQVLELADLGVALLMFSLGLQFSLRELLSVGRIVTIGAPVQVAGTLLVMLAIGGALGWPVLQSAFVGGAVGICSTVVLAKVAGEGVLRETQHGRIAVGWSIVQDLLTVALVVVLTALAAESGDPMAAVFSTLIAIGFVAAVLLLGSSVLPWILARIASLGSRELFVISVALLAIGTAFAASSVGVSVALGAFVAGLAVSEPALTASVLGEIVPLRELFATLFFVSVGLLLQPAAVLAGWPVVLLLVVLIVVAKLVPVVVAAVAAGQAPSTGLRAGTLLAQSGEFSFVLATAGVAAGVVTAEVFSQAMGAVVLSIVLAAPIFALGDAAARRLDTSRLTRRRPPPIPQLPVLRRHAVVAGYGRVGRSVARALESRGFPWIAIDADFRVVSAARDRGHAVIYGDVGVPSVLDEASVETAHTLVLAVPDPLANRQAVAYARRRNPRIGIVARAHSEADDDELRRMGVERVVLAERQIGNELMRHTLRRFGVSDREIAPMLSRER